MRAFVSFDTLEYMDELKRAGMRQEEAEAITKATAKAFVQMMETKELATKSDVLLIKNNLQAMKIELQGFIVRSVSTAIILLGSIQTVFHFYK